MIRLRRFRRRLVDHRLKVHKSMSRAFKGVLIQPDIIIYGETLRTRDLGSFRSRPVGIRVRPNRFSGSIIPRRFSLARVFLYPPASRPLNPGPAKQSTPGSSKEKQNAGNAEHRDRQQPEIIFQKVRSA